MRFDTPSSIAGTTPRELDAQAPVIPFRLPRPIPTGTIGPCLTCRCSQVNVNLLTNFVRYCECPQCGNAWTEPAKARYFDEEAPYFPSEPLKFVRDRN